ncbi:MAG: bacteriohemerythrin [Gammaproteobacteria bacterium SHHR-1]|uniref:bacteriohemerythrin n=1 Tax=Magnetovirga frankeli TaxID=947516 RepID=UPI001293F505|nr:hemerythrin family protein [gamma proteobacterium SS-5]
MRKSLQTFGLSLFIILAFIVIGFGFTYGIGNPVPWIMIVLLLALPYAHQRLTEKRFVTWSDDLSVGIEAIDDDHKRLLGLINNLQNAVYYPTGEAFERQSLEELVAYTKYHFEREEALMEKHGYADLEPHKQQHEKMIAEVERYLQAYEKDPESTIEGLTRFLKDWLIKHIRGTDQQYSAYLRGKGER